MAQEKGCTSAQLALAWLLAQAPGIVPIPGTRSNQRLAENAAATDLTLSTIELTALNQTLEQTLIQGERYPEAFKSLLFADTPAL